MHNAQSFLSLVLLTCLSTALFAADTPVANSAAPAHLQKAMANPADNPELPNVLIIGDSISIGYTVAVRKLLDGKADVFRPNTNCQFSSHGVANIKRWLGGTKWDVIHFNFGIWDTHFMHKGRLTLDRAKYAKNALTRRVTTTGYVANLSKILAVLKTTDAKLIWASTTPWVSYGEDTKALIVQNNSAAAGLMKKEGVAVNDLHSLAVPKLKDWHAKDGVHFTAQGYEGLGKQAAAAIARALGQE